MSFESVHASVEKPSKLPEALPPPRDVTVLTEQLSARIIEDIVRFVLHHNRWCRICQGAFSTTKGGYMHLREVHPYLP